MDLQTQIDEQKKTISRLENDVRDLTTTKKIIYAVGIILFAATGIGWYKLSEANKSIDEYKNRIVEIHDSSLNAYSKSIRDTSKHYLSQFSPPKVDQTIQAYLRDLEISMGEEEHTEIPAHFIGFPDIPKLGNRIEKDEPIVLIAVRTGAEGKIDAWYRKINIRLNRKRQ